MAKNAYARISGDVLRVEHREGIGAKSQKPYSMDIAVVLVGTGGTTEIILPTGVLVGAGESVDFLVEVRTSQYGFDLSVLPDPDNSHSAVSGVHVAA